MSFAYQTRNGMLFFVLWTMGCMAHAQHCSSTYCCGPCKDNGTGNHLCLYGKANSRVCTGSNGMLANCSFFTCGTICPCPN